MGRKINLTFNVNDNVVFGCVGWFHVMLYPAEGTSQLAILYAHCVCGL